jgi:hypothetical protein
MRGGRTLASDLARAHSITDELEQTQFGVCNAQDEMPSVGSVPPTESDRSLSVHEPRYVCRVFRGEPSGLHVAGHCAPAAGY